PPRGSPLLRLVRLPEVDENDLAALQLARHLGRGEVLDLFLRALHQVLDARHEASLPAARRGRRPSRGLRGAPAWGQGAGRARRRASASPPTCAAAAA